MIQCPKCSAENADDSRFCKSCGQEITSISQAPTVAAKSPPAPVDVPHVGRIVSSDSVPAGGFTPGTVLSDRYRIIGLLGRGGMGEVYRADDLKLGQPVALKFLPPALAQDSVRRERFFAEVRITRQLSHPNICRVYDIGEVDGRHFLSMEYIDGEDLASLMKRIGHLSNEKALDIARQLVAGLSVAHERGVLHRDLKPANIMLDGHGRVRITDFGLAIAAGDEAQAEEIAGTPAYMAPEQLAGKGATVRSDIYSLGLILYEIYTGKKAFKAKTLAELREQKETRTPRAPSELREGIDPVVERVIQRCMEKDPSSRPASVAQLAQALPGGDPLAAAIAAGETPSPEMVAASGSKEGLRPLVAWGLLLFIVVGFGIVIMLDQGVSILDRMSIERPPEVLVQTARDILKDIGYTDPPADSASRFITDTTYLEYIGKNSQSANRYEKIPALTIQFWYRQSPLILNHTSSSSGISLVEPPFTNSGESIVWLDSKGRFIGLRVIPAEEPVRTDLVQPPNWSLLFEAAGLDEENFNDAETESIPPFVADTWKAWTGTLPDFPNTTVRIEAAAWKGRPVFWQMIVPSWDNFRTATLPTVQLTPGTGTNTPSIIISIIAVLIVIVGPAYFARRNLRIGRGDRRGALRMACVIFSLHGIEWVFSERHIAGSPELGLFVKSAGTWLILAGLVWLLYIALEPFVRRRWPQMLVSWSRLLAGNYRDSLIGRDLLVGCLTYVALRLFDCVIGVINGYIGTPQPRPSIPEMDLFLGTPAIIAWIMGKIAENIIIGLFIAFVVFILRILLRKTWIATIVLALFLTSFGYFFDLINPVSVITVIGTAVIMACVLFMFFRFGLLAFLSWAILTDIGLSFPITPHFSVWYKDIVIIGLTLFAVLILYAFRTSLGGRPMFGTPRLDE